MHRLIIILLTLGFFSGCAPKEPILFRAVHMRSVEVGTGGPMLKADVVFYNPNKGSMRLKEITLDILLDDKPAAFIDQKLTAHIKGQSEFTVPLELQFKRNEGLVETIFNMFGGKKHSVRFTGRLRVKVKGFPVNIPIDYKDEIKF